MRPDDRDTPVRTRARAVKRPTPWPGPRRRRVSATRRDARATSVRPDSEPRYLAAAPTPLRLSDSARGLATTARTCSAPRALGSAHQSSTARTRRRALTATRKLRCGSSVGDAAVGAQHRGAIDSASQACRTAPRLAVPLVRRLRCAPTGAARPVRALPVTSIPCGRPTRAVKTVRMPDRDTFHRFPADSRQTAAERRVVSVGLTETRVPRRGGRAAHRAVGRWRARSTRHVPRGRLSPDAIDQSSRVSAGGDAKDRRRGDGVTPSLGRYPSDRHRECARTSSAV